MHDRLSVFLSMIYVTQYGIICMYDRLSVEYEKT